MLFRSLPLVDESLVPPTEDTVNFDLQHSHQLKFTLTSAHFKMHILFHILARPPTQTQCIGL